jgi:hypothetical protein
VDTATEELVSIDEFLEEPAFLAFFIDAHPSPRE